MSIINPRYAFLEADYSNPNLNQEKAKDENTSENTGKKSGHIGNATLALTLKTTAVINWMIVFLITLPVDIYCVIMLLILKDF